MQTRNEGGVMDIQKAREKFAEINLKEGFYTEEELSITNLGVFECAAAEQDWEKWWECLIYYVEPMQQAQKVAVPEGFVLVPREPTKQQIDYVVDQMRLSGGLDMVEQIYKAMIEAQGANP